VNVESDAAELYKKSVSWEEVSVKPVLISVSVSVAVFS